MSRIWEVCGQLGSQNSDNAQIKAHPPLGPGLPGSVPYNCACIRGGGRLYLAGSQIHAPTAMGTENPNPKPQPHSANPNCDPKPRPQIPRHGRSLCASDDWTWTTQADGSLLFAHKPDGLLAESARPLTFEQLMSAYDAPARAQLRAEG